MKSRRGIFVLQILVLVAAASGLAVRVPERPVGGAFSTAARIEGLFQRISADSMLDTVNFLANQKSRRFTDEGAANTVAFITRRLEDMGYAVEHHHVATMDAGGQAFVVTNLVADMAGAGRSPFILCAHYDSRGEGEEDLAPGADDNASGVAVLLEAARIFAETGVDPHVTLVFFGGEEDSLIGSRAFADKISRERTSLRGVVNVDMVGYDEYGPLDIVVFTNPQSMPLAARVAELARRRTRLAVSLTVTTTGNSDHAAFWRVGQPAVSIWEGYDHNPYHATSKDLPAVLTPHFMVEIARLVVSIAVELGGTTDPLPKRWIPAKK